MDIKMDLVEKIEKLAKECDFSDEMIENNIENFIQFAQMIVKDCAEVMKTKYQEAKENNTYMGGTIPINGLVYEIHKRFDIK